MDKMATLEMLAPLEHQETEVTLDLQEVTEIRVHLETRDPRDQLVLLAIRGLVVPLA